MATAEEIAWWEIFRPAIAAYVSQGKIWISPETGQQLSRCPWLQPLADPGRYTCGIYHDRPDDCRQYPVEFAQMVADDCEMLELRDLDDPARAQRTLDRLMADSRPPRE